ncbi:(2Fe-2S)-binding protein [Pigmentiphaga aceris]|uniref:(2Fe-2S)-binding protein n=1 Tax=Pigmentiphaga aceris TaxID=1940612 RepID=A0A5C0AXQ4_9BURK|nr:(2Fe-2S)-binding protein [Pigmentiphaga aceris]QEI06344.1 (2Fe-2S)-binding protein [Pigmentiphaga aceris]
MSLLKRLVDTERAPVAFVLDGKACQALLGDTVLTAVLTQADRLRQSEFSGRPRAGFCMMGACQDCWVRTEDGRRLRACSTFIEEDMQVVTTIVQVPVATQAAAWPEDET